METAKSSTQQGERDVLCLTVKFGCCRDTKKVYETHLFVFLCSVLLSTYDELDNHN